MSDDTVSPFHCGAQFLDWSMANCERGCSRDGKCEIQDALEAAAWDDGSVSAEIGRRMGYDDERFPYLWPCPEHDPPFKPDAKEAT